MSSRVQQPSSLVQSSHPLAAKSQHDQQEQEEEEQEQARQADAAVRGGGRPEVHGVLPPSSLLAAVVSALPPVAVAVHSLCHSATRCFMFVLVTSSLYCRVWITLSYVDYCGDLLQARARHSATSE